MLNTKCSQGSFVIIQGVGGKGVHTSIPLETYSFVICRGLVHNKTPLIWTRMKSPYFEHVITLEFA